MSDKEKVARDSLLNLSDSLVVEINDLSEDELFAEAKDNGKDPESIAGHISSLISNVIHETGRAKMKAARAAYDAKETGGTANVLNWPLQKKRGLLNDFSQNDNNLQQKLTLAARNGEDTEADIDSFLEDLIDLGIIDDEGDLK